MNTFKNAGAAISTSRTPIYATPTATQTVIHALYISNIDGVNDGSVTIEVTIDGGSTYRHIAKTVSVPANSTLILDKPINMEADDILALTASAAGDLEVFASILEIS
jgi:type III secretory pathway lipoprotein EscJ